MSKFLYKANELIQLSQKQTNDMYFGGAIKTDLHKAVNLLNEGNRSFSATKTYDIFLCHSIDDARIINGLKNDLVAKGLSVYVDWIEDTQLDRTNVNTATANIIRTRIKSCSSVVYAFSEVSKHSSWVQWELGYGDGQKNGKVAILPIQESSMDKNFYKQEYLGLYPYIDHATRLLWINKITGGHMHFHEWLEE